MGIHLGIQFPVLFVSKMHQLLGVRMARICRILLIVPSETRFSEQFDKAIIPLQLIQKKVQHKPMEISKMGPLITIGTSCSMEIAEVCK